MTTLSDGTTTVALPDALAWTDEYTWAPVEQNVQRTLTGALIVTTTARTVGRPITLAQQADGGPWVLRPALQQLQAWAAVPGQALTLTLRGVALAVMLRHQDVALEATSVMPFADVAASDAYRLTLRLMTI